MKRAVRDCETFEALLAALDAVIDKDATPDPVPERAMILQPSEERRRSGSHYTPRELTEPIVRNTVGPLLSRLRCEQGGTPHPEQILDLKVCDPAMGSGAFLVEACRQLGDALVAAWHAHDALPDIPPDEDETVFARRQVAQRCLYGLDRNPTAVDLAKLSLWLVTLAKEHPLTFLDHALRHGDALVGLSREQIEAFHWQASGGPFQKGIESAKIRDHLAETNRLRQRIREADDNVPDSELRDLWARAEFEAGEVAFLGDLALAAFFEGTKAKEREERRKEFAGAVATDEANQYRSWIEELRHQEPPLAPFHWPIEFPEVFDRENPGFDAMVGNPPFAGKNTTIAANYPGYPHWLKQAHPESHGNSDLVAHFFRRAFNLIREGGAFGLIATNTIAQGDTRSTGLRWICENGGEIYNARRRFKWPGLAAVVVSILHVSKGTFDGVKLLDGREVERITAFLFHRGGHGDPARLEANAGKSFVGSYVLGMGFTFDDTDNKGVATPLAEMRRLIEENPGNDEVIYPYIGGEELNSSPTHAHYRYVIDFRDYPLRREELDQTWATAGENRRRQWLQQGIVPLDYPKRVAADWPNLLAIVEEKAKPDRDVQNRKALRERWWQHAEKRPGLYSAVDGLNKVLLISRVGQHASLAFVPGHMVYAESTIVFPLPTFAAFGTLQSRPHDVWARFFGSSMKDDLRYTPSDCFETYPFPDSWVTHSSLETAGKSYYKFRADLMVKSGEGMTKTYNRFHNRNEDSADILHLRHLHAAMDRAVLDAYSWTDIPTDCDFLLDHESDEEEPRQSQKARRYRWPNDIRDEVLARLLELNAKRHAQEVETNETHNLGQHR